MKNIKNLKVLAFCLSLTLIASNVYGEITFNEIWRNNKNMNHLQWKEYFNTLEGKKVIGNARLFAIEEPTGITFIDNFFKNSYSLRLSIKAGCTNVKYDGLSKKQVFNMKVGQVYKISGIITDIKKFGDCGFYIHIK
ncbi:MAG: hypothetical protein KAT06_05785 [Gammaproteobacteria bacterium]|nr:hypothetical protein [Gammaproteobacteria bacterium]